MSLKRHLRPHSGRYWRSIFVGQEKRVLEPASAPVGRWHQAGQRALYLSETPEGCRVATKVYRRAEDPPRLILAIDISNAVIVDLRDPSVREAFSAPLEAIHAFWAEHLNVGEASPTWRIADAFRDLGAHGILTPSRSRPDLTHLTLFAWNGPNEPIVKFSGESVPH